MKFEINYDSETGPADLVKAAVAAANGDEIVIRVAIERVKNLGRIVASALRKQMKELSKDVSVVVESHPTEFKKVFS
jgi:hypothetical protein